MTSYHIILRFKEGEKNHYGIWYNLTQEKVMTITSPLNENKSFWFLGKRLQSSWVETINIFSSNTDFRKIILPSGVKAIDADIDQLETEFLKGIIEFGVVLVTSEFLTQIKESNPMNETFPKQPKLLDANETKIFIVHGRDKVPALELKDYLKDNLKLNAVIFDDEKKKKTSPTIIEILEDIMSNAGYAFIVATPDDLGTYCKDIEKCKEELLMNPEAINVKSIQTILSKFKTRARQNVVFEHGLFLGALGRDKVCCLLQFETQDKQTDIDGILYVPFKESVRETFPEIVEKLKDPKIGLIKP